MTPARLLPLLLLVPLLAACGGDDVRIVRIHGVKPAGPGACVAAEGASAASTWDVASGEAYWVTLEVQNFTSDPQTFDTIQVELDDAAPWNFMPVSAEATTAISLAPAGEEGDTGLFVVRILDEYVGTAALLGSELGPSPIDQAGESFPLNFTVTVVGGEELQIEPVKATVTLCNRCQDKVLTSEAFEPCNTGLAEGCSIGQADAFACVP